MKKLLVLLNVLAITACTTTAKDDRICIDFGSYTFVREKCTPLYGQLICMDVEQTEVYCKLYEETQPIRPESD